MMEYYTVRTCAMHAVSPFCAFARFVVCTMLHVARSSFETMSRQFRDVVVLFVQLMKVGMLAIASKAVFRQSVC